MDTPKFLLVGTKDSLPADRDTNKLYWCSDTRELYKGMDLYTEAVRVVPRIPDTPATGILYIIPSGEAKVYTGSEWVTVALPFVTEGTVTTDSTNAEVPTAKVVYDSIVAAVAESVNGGDVVNNIVSTKAGIITVTVGETETDVALKGTVINPSYDAATRTITLPFADGSESLLISLGKDIFIDPSANNRYEASDKSIHLYLNDGAGEQTPTEIVIPVASFIDVYTGATTSTVEVTVSEDNRISANVKVSAAEGNMITVTDDGLLVSASGFAKASDLESLTNRINTAESDIDAVEGRLDILEGDVSTENSIAYKIAAAKEEIKTTTDALSERLDAIEGDGAGSIADAIKTANTYTDLSLAWATF